MTSTPHQESERTAAIAATMKNPTIRQKMYGLSEEWLRMGRYDAVPVPQHERGE